jgi:hypothetical protein
MAKLRAQGPDLIFAGPQFGLDMIAGLTPGQEEQEGYQETQGDSSGWTSMVWTKGDPTLEFQGSSPLSSGAVPRSLVHEAGLG